MKFLHNHLNYHILGNSNDEIRTPSSLKNICANLAFLSQIELNNFEEAGYDENWFFAIQDEINQFETNKSFMKLVPIEKDQQVTVSKWVFKTGAILRNKARLVAHNFNQQESICRRQN